jgi:pimeloyl-ACP methyl ester carboxylesterase
MKSESIPGRSGYDIPCVSHLTGGEDLVVLISHGFGSSKQSPTAQAVLAALPGYGIGACAFDFPSHGESPAPGELLRIPNCLDDLAAVEAHVRRQAPRAEIAYFSSSFGAYVNLIYLSTREHAGTRSFLRCTAVDMAAILRRGITPAFQSALEKKGYFIMDEGYVRPLKITRQFLADLDRNDLFRLCRPGMAKLAMIHGADDETAPIADARRFARFVGAELTEVEGADHRFQIPGGLELIVEKAEEFFTRCSL